MKEGWEVNTWNSTYLWARDDHYYQQAAWRGTKALDGGTLMNQCIHNIDLLQWLMGGEVERLYSETDTFIRDIELKIWSNINEI